MRRPKRENIDLARRIGKSTVWFYNSPHVARIKELYGKVDIETIDKYDSLLFELSLMLINIVENKVMSVKEISKVVYPDNDDAGSAWRATYIWINRLSIYTQGEYNFYSTRTLDKLLKLKAHIESAYPGEAL